MNHSLALPRLGSLLLLGILTACSQSTPDESGTTGAVAVTTTRPLSQTFHDTVEAWGSAIGDPQRARVISLAHGGQVLALAVAPGQRVRRGQTLLVIAPEPAARSAWQQAQSGLALARGELTRTGQLAAQRLATQSQLATARKALADAQATLAAQRALGSEAAKQPVTAPVDGVVDTLSVGLGERFAANAPLLAFTPAQALVAQLGIPPEAGATLRAGMPVQLRAVYGDQPAFSGTLRMVGQALDPQTHLLGAQVELPAEAGATLVAGMPLQAQIRRADFTAWAVPRAAVLHDEKGDYLFQLENGHAKRVAVTLRSADGDPVGVQGPLDAKARVVVLGVYELNDGDAVREAAK